MSGSTALSETIDEKTLSKYVRFLAGSFRTGEAEDAEVMARGLTALLGSYPEWVVRAVCDPRSGLPSTSKFFPTLYEVRSACESKMRPILEAERRRVIQERNDADKPDPVDDLAAERRKAFIANWRQRQAIQEAKLSVEAAKSTPMAKLDARQLHGDHRDMVLKAIESDISAQVERNKSTPVTLSEAAMKTNAGRARETVGVEA